MRFTCNPKVWQLEWPSQAWKQICWSGLCSSNPPGNHKGQSFSLSGRTRDYVGEIRQKRIECGDGEEAGFLSDRAKPPHFPRGFFPAWLRDCPAAVMTLSKYISSEKEGWNQLFFCQSNRDNTQYESMEISTALSNKTLFALNGWPMFIDEPQNQSILAICIHV